MATKRKTAKKAAKKAVAQTKAVEAVEAAKPYVQRLVEDDDLRANLREAYDSARDAYDRAVDGKGPAKVLEDKKLQSDLKTAAESLRSAAESLREPEKKEKSHGFAKVLLVAIVAAAAAVVLSEDVRKALLDRLFGAEEEFEYTSTTTPPATRLPQPAADDASAPSARSRPGIVRLPPLMEAATTGKRELSGDKAQRIVDAMRASVAARGIAGSTFEHVAGEAGVSRGLLHYYFGTKERLLVEVVRSDTELRLARLDEPLAAASTADDVLDVLVSNLLDTIENEPGVFVLALRGLLRRPPQRGDRARGRRPLPAHARQHRHGPRGEAEGGRRQPQIRLRAYGLLPDRDRRRDRPAGALRPRSRPQRRDRGGSRGGAPPCSLPKPDSAAAQPRSIDAKAVGRCMPKDVWVRRASVGLATPIGCRGGGIQERKNKGLVVLRDVHSAAARGRVCGRR